MYIKYSTYVSEFNARHFHYIIVRIKLGLVHGQDKIMLHHIKCQILRLCDNLTNGLVSVSH